MKDPVRTDRERTSAEGSSGRSASLFAAWPARSSTRNRPRQCPPCRAGCRRCRASASTRPTPGPDAGRQASPRRREIGRRAAVHSSAWRTRHSLRRADVTPRGRSPAADDADCRPSPLRTRRARTAGEGVHEQHALLDQEWRVAGCGSTNSEEDMLKRQSDYKSRESDLNENRRLRRPDQRSRGTGTGCARPARPDRRRAGQPAGRRRSRPRSRAFGSPPDAAGARGRAAGTRLRIRTPPTRTRRSVAGAGAVGNRTQHAPHAGRAQLLEERASFERERAAWNAQARPKRNSSRIAATSPNRPRSGPGRAANPSPARIRGASPRTGGARIATGRPAGNHRAGAPETRSRAAPFGRRTGHSQETAGRRDRTGAQPRSRRDRGVSARTRRGPLANRRGPQAARRGARNGPPR